MMFRHIYVYDDPPLQSLQPLKGKIWNLVSNRLNRKTQYNRNHKGFSI